MYSKTRALTSVYTLYCSARCCVLSLVTLYARATAPGKNSQNRHRKLAENCRNWTCRQGVTSVPVLSTVPVLCTVQYQYEYTRYTGPVQLYSTLKHVRRTHTLQYMYDALLYNSVPVPYCTAACWYSNPSVRTTEVGAVSYTHLRAHETVLDLVCRLLLEKKK